MNFERRTSNVELNAGNSADVTSTFNVRIYRAARTAFSFAEVMFAVVILGIGFIMVAAVFPVAIQQTQVNGEENIAASVARQAAAAIASMPMTYPNPIYDQTVAIPAPPTPAPPTTVKTILTFPPTVKNYVRGTDPNAADAPSVVVPLVGARWNFTKTISILPSDPRYAYAAFYKRDSGTTSAELIVVSMAVRNRSTYSPLLDELSAQQVAAVQANPTNPQQPLVNISTIPANFSAAGTHTVICPDTAIVPSASEGSTIQFPNTVISPGPVGRTYALGRSINAALGTWELFAGDNMALTAGSNGKWGTSGATEDTNSTGQGSYVNSPATMQPVVAYARLFSAANSPTGRIQLNVTPIPGDPVPAAAIAGAFVIIADDFPALPALEAVGGIAANYNQQPNISGSYTVGSMNGRIFRLGAAVPPSVINSNDNPIIQPGTFNLDPAYGMRPVPPGGVSSPDQLPNPAMIQAANNSADPDAPWLGVYGSAKVYIIGAGRADPTSTGNAGYSGPAQDIGAFASFIQVQ